MPGQCKYSYVSFLGISDPEVFKYHVHAVQGNQLVMHSF